MSGLADLADGPLLLALPVALLAGLVAFASPCVLPLVPGYLAYVTGLGGAGRSAADAPRDASPAGRGTTLAATRTGLATRHAPVLGAALFVAGFSAVFLTFGALFGGLSQVLQSNAELLTRVLGGVVVVLGLGFLGLVPLLERQWRPARLPRAGLAGAPLLGVTFGLGWTPCIGPTLAVVLGLATEDGSAARGTLLTAAYCVGLGLPFVAVAAGLTRAMRVVGFLRRHARAVQLVGGALLVVVGLLLLTGWWSDLVVRLQVWSGGFTPAL